MCVSIRSIRAAGRVYQPQQSVLYPQSAHRQTACMRYTFAPPQRSHTAASLGRLDVRSAGGGETGMGVLGASDMSRHYR